MTDTAGNVSQFVCYTPYGEAIVDEHLTTYENPFNFSGKELDAITGLYDHGARNRNPISTLWYGIDPLFEKYPDFSPYNYCAGNPVKFIDPDGRLSKEHKQVIANVITASADHMHEYYKKTSRFLNNHPSICNGLNKSLAVLRNGINHFVDYNKTDNFSWMDLTSIWLLELGGGNKDFTSYFGQNAVTTKSLMSQEGVCQARSKMIDQIKNGGDSKVTHTWIYGQKEFYDCLKEQNIATAFLGSYSVDVNSKLNDDGTYTFNFTVVNVSSMESATRFRKDNDGNGVHDAIIPSHERGSKNSITIGGNYKQIWQWSETVEIK